MERGFFSNYKKMIEVEDYAIAMIDDLENPKHVRARFTVGY
jgi:uncharacterized protein